MIMDAKPTASEMLEWIFAHNVTVLEQASGGFACLYQALGGRAAWGPSARSKRDAVLAAMDLHRSPRNGKHNMTEPQDRGLA